MANLTPDVTAIVQASRESLLGRLSDFLRIPSVSTLPEHRAWVMQAAEFVRLRLLDVGLENVRLIPTEGHPLVYGDWMHAPGQPVILCYGHYDVQPADPLAEWRHPPFEPTVIGSDIFARGATDNKGQILAHIEAAALLLKNFGRLPVNLRFVIEGEEEIGSSGLLRFLHEHSSELACDAVLVSDSEMFAPDTPCLDLGVRGMVYAEVEVEGAKRDLHSGLYGGVAPNPLEAIARMITGLKDADGRILIPGFYDRVQSPHPREKASWQALPFSEKHWREELVQARGLPGEKGFAVLERVWVRPTLEIHGITGGFTGAGAKTVIPARASVKLSLRLVPDQSPSQVAASLEAAVRSLFSSDYTVNFRLLSVADPAVMSPDTPFHRAAGQALAEVFQRDAVFIRCGGSIPIVPAFMSQLHCPVVMMGLALPDDGPHAPNEKFHLPNFYRGIAAVAGFWRAAAKA